MDGAIDSARSVARVAHVASDGHHIYVEYRNGLTARVTNEERQFDFEVGDVLLIDAATDELEIAPSELWPSEPWVGIVRISKPDVLVVEVNGRHRIFQGTDSDYAVGNTVEGSDTEGVTGLLDKDPIRQVDLPSIDDSAIAGFIVKPDPGGLSFDDFGGLPSVVRRSRELIEFPLEHREALDNIGARPIKGVLFTGPPGTGKTMLARIIANQAGATFYEIRGPEIFSKWYGESEELLRRLFDHAASQTRSIVFFDEIDSVAPQRQEAHEASRRVVAQLLSLMDGFTPEQNVMVVATTNRPQDIDAALRRPGRLDWEIDFTKPDQEDREEILRVSSAKLETKGELPHQLIASRTEGWSAADLTAIWSESALIAVDDGGREAILAEDYFAGYERVAVQHARELQALAAEIEDGQG
jgi:transitional endoplasmic reticulum ATPase